MSSAGESASVSASERLRERLKTFKQNTLIKPSLENSFKSQGRTSPTSGRKSLSISMLS